MPARNFRAGICVSIVDYFDGVLKLPLFFWFIVLFATAGGSLTATTVSTALAAMRATAAMMTLYRIANSHYEKNKNY